jgi:hypothetical protein
MSLTLTILYQPHKGQSEFHESKTRFRILSCGRRWGKTKAGANEAIRKATESPNESVGFCVAPTYWHTQKQWREFLTYCPSQLVKEINRADHHVLLIGNRHVWFKSADNPDSLRSEGLDWLWVDEGAEISEEAWDMALRPALIDRKGCAWFTGTPKGKNWYFRLWTKGNDPLETEYKSWSFPSNNNPYLDIKELEKASKGMTELAYRQEIMAEFIEDVGSVFRGIDGLIKGELEQPNGNKQYVMGADIAKTTDYTVLIVMDGEGHVCAFERFSQLDWVLITRRIVNLAKQYNARILIDASGVGSPVYDTLQREQVHVEGYKFTEASKKDLVENLSIAIDNKTISYPLLPELVNELKLFGYTQSPSGGIHYGAPEGYHDDCVISLALATWQIKKASASISFVGNVRR